VFFSGDEYNGDCDLNWHRTQTEKLRCMSLTGRMFGPAAGRKWGRIGSEALAKLADDLSDCLRSSGMGCMAN
jgi:hypothetical protein